VFPFCKVCTRVHEGRHKSHLVTFPTWALLMQGNATNIQMQTWSNVGLYTTRHHASCKGIVRCVCIRPCLPIPAKALNSRHSLPATEKEPQDTWHQCGFFNTSICEWQTLPTSFSCVCLACIFYPHNLQSADGTPCILPCSYGTYSLIFKPPPPLVFVIPRPG